MDPELPYGHDGRQEPVTFQDLGISTVHNTRLTILGKVQTCSSLKPVEHVFLTSSVISFLISLGLTIHRLVTLDKTADDFTFAILLLVTTAFCLYYAVNGTFLERMYEILVCVVSTLIVTIYCVLNYAYGTHETLKLVRMVVALVLGSIVVGTGFRISLDFYKSGDLVYRTVGANIELQRCCNFLFAVSSLLGLDLQLEASMLIFVMRNGAQLKELEIVILSVGIPLAIVWFILGCFAMRLESKTLSAIFLSLSWAQPAYVIYKFVALYDIRASILKYSIIACGIFSLIVRTFLVSCFVIVFTNYGQGLKEKVYGHKVTTNQN